MAELTCPKCLSTMRAIDRNGITIERCESCGGVYLDRSELDQIIKLESEFVNQQFQPTPDRRQDRYEYRGNERDRDRDFGDFDDWDDDDDHRHRGRRKKSFLDDLFDF